MVHEQKDLYWLVVSEIPVATCLHGIFSDILAAEKCFPCEADQSGGLTFVSGIIAKREPDTFYNNIISYVVPPSEVKSDLLKYC